MVVGNYSGVEKMKYRQIILNTCGRISFEKIEIDFLLLEHTFGGWRRGQKVTKAMGSVGKLFERTLQGTSDSVFDTLPKEIFCFFLTLCFQEIR
jgi:hypothetical protein